MKNKLKTQIIVITIIAIAILAITLKLFNSNNQEQSSTEIVKEEQLTVEEMLESIKDIHNEKTEIYQKPIKPSDELLNKSVITDVSFTNGSINTTYYISYTPEGLLSSIRLYQDQVILDMYNQPKYTPINDILYSYSYKDSKLQVISELILTNNGVDAGGSNIIEVKYVDENTITLEKYEGREIKSIDNFKFTGDASKLITHIPINLIDEAIGWYNLDDSILLLSHEHIDGTSQTESTEYTYNNSTENTEAEIDITKVIGDIVNTSKIKIDTDGFRYWSNAENEATYRDYKFSEDKKVVEMEVIQEGNEPYRITYNINRMTFDEIYYNQVKTYVDIVKQSEG